MANSKNKKKRPAQTTARTTSVKQEQTTVRRAPTPPPPIQYTQSANMPGYDDELMPPRPVHKAVDNGIQFPTGQSSTSRPGNSRTTSQTSAGRSTQNRASQSGTAQRRPTAQTNGQRRTNNGSAQNAAQRQGRTANSSQRTARPNAKQPVKQANAKKKSTAPRRPAQTVAQKEAQRKKKITKKTMRRRKLYRRLTAAALFLSVIVIGTMLTVTMLFKITAIEVRDGDGVVSEQIGAYTREQILTALGVELDENIFSFKADSRAAQMEKLLPLLENIQVQRKYPGTVVVRATPATAVCATPSKEGWLQLSVSLKILSVTSEQPDLPVLYGGEPATTQPGNILDFDAVSVEDADSTSETSGGKMEALNAVLNMLLEKELIQGVTRLEFEDLDQIAFLYEDRISVLLGTTNELEYKMQFARYLLLNEEGKGCAATDTGVIDCSHVRTDGTIRPTFAQGKATMPSGYDPSEPKTVIEVTQPTETTTPTEAESEAPSSTETETESAGESEPTTAEGESESEAEAPTESEPAGTEGEGETEEETTEPTEQTAASEAA